MIASHVRHSRTYETATKKFLRQSLKSSGFQIEQPFFPPKPSSVSADGAVARDDTMAGDDDRNLIFSIRRADRAIGIRRADPLRQVAVAERPTKRDAHQFLPHSLLKWRARLRNANHEFLPLAGEVFENFVRKWFEYSSVAYGPFGWRTVER